MPTDKTIDRVNDLIARATDAATTEEERRTSAVIACKLIKSAGLQVIDPAGSTPPADGEPVSGGTGGTRVSWVDIGFDKETEEMIGRVAKHGFDKVVDAWFKRQVDDASKPARQAREQVYRPREGQGLAGNTGVCKCCKKKYTRGDRIRYRTDLGQMIHYTCDWPDDLQPDKEHGGQGGDKST